MHVLRLLGLYSLASLLVADPILSSPLVTLDGSNQVAAAPHWSRRSFQDSYTLSKNLREPWRADSSLLKRAGRPLDHGITLHAFRTATYIGARTVLEHLYSQIFAHASNQTPGSSIRTFDAEYGNVVVSFDSDEPFGWDVIKEFADTMLGRVLNGELNFYIANIVYDIPRALGQQQILFVMGTPETRQDIANEPWAATLKEWLDRHGL